MGELVMRAVGIPGLTPDRDHRILTDGHLSAQIALFLRKVLGAKNLALFSKSAEGALVALAPHTRPPPPLRPRPYSWPWTGRPGRE